MDVFQQHAGYRVFQATALIATHQPVIEKVDLGRLQDGSGDIAAPGLYRKNDVQRLQNIQITFERTWRYRQIAGNQVVEVTFHSDFFAVVEP